MEQNFAMSRDLLAMTSPRIINLFSLYVVQSSFISSLRIPLTTKVPRIPPRVTKGQFAEARKATWPNFSHLILGVSRIGVVSRFVRVD